MKLEIHNVNEISQIAEKILSACGKRRIFAIYGDLGAGKTTLVKSMCLHLGAGDVAKSPTFAIVNEYEALEDNIYHFDFYRIKRLEEAYDLGFEEYFDSGHFCFIEWPEMVEPLLPEDLVEIRIEATGPTSRRFSVALH